MQLSPSGGLLISSAQGYDKDAPVTRTIVATGHDTFVGWEWSISPTPPSPITARESGPILTVGWWSSVRFHFPITDITFIEPGTMAQERTVPDWSGVPSGAEITRYRPHRNNFYNYTLSVTAHGLRNTSSGPNPVSASGTYTIRLEHHHNQYRDDMRSLVNAGRSSFG